MNEAPDIIDPNEIAPNGEIFESAAVKKEFKAAEEVNKELPYSGLDLAEG